MVRQLEHEQLIHDPSPMTGQRFAQLQEATSESPAFGPLPSETLTQLGGFAVGAGANIGSCVP